MGLEDLYQEIILDHYKKPRNPGRLEHGQIEVHHYNPNCRITASKSGICVLPSWLPISTSFGAVADCR